MSLSKEKIKQVLLQLLGPDTNTILSQLYGKENISEFLMADKTKLDIKVIRRLLYVLYNHNLVSFTRKKDKIKGWYVYYWTLETPSIIYFYVKRRKEQLRRLEKFLEEEEGQVFFYSKESGIRLSFDQAMDYDFRCPETGKMLIQEDKDFRINKMKERIKVLRDEIDEVKLPRKSEKELMSLLESKVQKKKVAKKAAKKVTKKAVKKVTKKSAKKSVKKVIGKKKDKKSVQKKLTEIKGNKKSKKTVKKSAKETVKKAKKKVIVKKTVKKSVQKKLMEIRAKNKGKKTVKKGAKTTKKDVKKTVKKTTKKVVKKRK